MPKEHEMLRYLKRVATYDANTGNFHRKKQFQTKQRPKIMGCVNALTGYRDIWGCGRSWLTHKLVWLWHYGELPTSEMDHINHIRDDNRIENLRVVTHEQNMKNRTLFKTNKLGYTGICPCNKTGKIQAYISYKGNVMHLGRYDTIHEALHARKQAELKYDYHKNHGKDEI